jgi:ATP-dependent exoDNAse (exonuclease V) beta subunit
VERGAVDCLLVTDDSATVLEFKTGAPRDEHRDQLAAYVEAMGAYYTGRRVDGRLIYVGSEPGR